MVHGVVVVGPAEGERAGVVVSKHGWLMRRDCLLCGVSRGC